MTDASVREDVSLESLVAQAADEFLERQKRGEQPDVEEYAARYPQAAVVLRKVLASLQLLGLSPSAGAAESGAASEGQVLGTLGDFRILREVGRGGMGVVYEAEQISLGRRVALKILPFAAALDPKQLQRFKNEAQAAAHLQHPHIVPVHYVGCERGVHFYAMQFIDGQTLAAVIRELRQLAGTKTADGAAPPGEASALASELLSGRWAPSQRNGNDRQRTTDYVPTPSFPQAPVDETTSPPATRLSTGDSAKGPAFFRTAAHLGVQAAEALEHAHQLGVIHRDIKPANLLVDAGGTLWLTDFGLARLGSQAGLTMSGDLLGTLRYMSPEQALAKRVAVDARTDVYSLGVTLYELLTLERAYGGGNREEVLRQIAFDEPRPPRRLNKAIPAELETIVLKAMAKSPAEPYASAQELADDLRRFQEDKPIRARRPTLLQRVRKWARRHQPVVWSAGVSAVLLLLLGVAALAVSNVRIGREKQQKEEALQEKEKVLQRERQNAYYHTIALAQSEWSANNLGRMLSLLDECPEDLRDWEWHYLKRLRLDGLPPLPHASAVLSVAFSPDGQRIASGGQDGVVKVWDAATGREVHSFRAHQDHANGLAFSPDGRRLATASWDGTVKIWDAKTGQEQLTLFKERPARAYSVAFSPDGRRLAAGIGIGLPPNEGGVIKVWDASTGQELLSLGGHKDNATCITFSPDGHRLASASADATAKVWDAQTGEEILTFRGHRSRIHSVAFSADGKQLASAPYDYRTKADGEVKVWDAQTGREVLTLCGHVSWVPGVAFTPDGRRLASGGLDGTVKLWDLATGQEALTLRGHNGTVQAIAFSPDGQRLVSAGNDRTVRIWDARPLAGEAGQEFLTLRGHEGGVRSVAFHPGGRYLASSGDDETVRLWDLQLGRMGGAQPMVHKLPGYTGFVTTVSFSSDGRLLASAGSASAKLRVWEATTWKELYPLGDAGLVASFSPDGRYLAAARRDFAVVILDAPSGRVIHTLRDHNWAIGAAAFSPDSRRLASGSADGTVRIWDVEVGKKILDPPLHHGGWVRSVVFSPDGGLLVSAGDDRIVKVWDTTRWKEVQTIRDLTGGVSSLAFHKDGRLVAWGGTDSTIKIGDVKTGEILHTLLGHTSWVEGVAFSSDGEWIASASLDGTIKLWRVPPAGEPRTEPAK
jgi:WD40 repeat protein/serine/threonine protein kinase